LKLQEEFEMKNKVFLMVAFGLVLLVGGMGNEAVYAQQKTPSIIGEWFFHVNPETWVNFNGVVTHFQLSFENGGTVRFPATDRSAGLWNQTGEIISFTFNYSQNGRTEELKVEGCFITDNLIIGSITVPSSFSFVRNSFILVRNNR
jgi:hypothetical protein